MKTLFLHVPKTGGVTLHYILRQCVGKHKLLLVKRRDINDFIPVANEKAKGYDLIQGHFDYGFHEHFNEPCRYLTFLRDPIKRSVSTYYFVLSKPDHRHHNELLEENYSLAEYITSGINPNTDNCHTRHLAGALHLPHGACTEETLQQALTNLRKIDFVGIVERFDESVVSMAMTFEWQIKYYQYLHKTKETRQRDPMDRKTMEVLEHFNRFDMKLYQEGLKLFENRLQEQGTSFTDRYNSFQRSFAIYKKLSNIKRTLLFQPRRY